MNGKYKIAGVLWFVGATFMASSYCEFMPVDLYQAGIGMLLLSGFFWAASLQSELEKNRKMQRILDQIDTEGIAVDGEVACTITRDSFSVTGPDAISSTDPIACQAKSGQKCNRPHWNDA